MPSPFPGMDPYLEHPQLWPDVHHRLISGIAIALGPKLRPTYRVAIEKAVYQTDGLNSLLIGVPDLSVQTPSTVARPQTSTEGSSATVVMPTTPSTVIVPMPEEVQLGYLEIRDVATGQVVTTIEVLSPVNKRGLGREKYERKRQQILASRTHLIEIDLLHAGEPMAILGDLVPSHYRVLVSRSEQRPRAELYGFNVQQPLPVFALPLRQGEEEPLVVLRSILDELYEQAGYDLIVDYRQEPKPGWPEAELAWMEEYLRQRGDR